MNKIFLTTILVSHATWALSTNSKTALDLQLTQVTQMLNQQISNEKQGSAFVTVGDTNDCDFRTGATRIQDAIDSGAAEVRIASGLYTENIIIDDIDLNLKGSYATCGDAVADNQGSIITTVINAADALPTIQVSGEAQRNTVLIDHIQISQGSGVGFTSGGGIAALGADVALSLFDVWISSNTGLLGGGISIIAGDTDIFGFNLNIINNTAAEGGGIFCSGNAGANSIFIYGDENDTKGIASNDATNGDGGGIHLSDGCVFTSYVGTSSLFDSRGIARNTATGNGGGIFAENGSVVNLIGTQQCAFIFCFGYDSEPVNINDNTADSDNDGSGNGGGIYATGMGTEVNVTNGLIADNEANNGGGLTVAEQATFLTNTTFKKGVDCWSPGSCNQITDNKSNRSGTLGSLGGAVYANTGGTAAIHRTHVQKNRADIGTAFYATGSDSLIESEGSLFTENGNAGSGGFVDLNVFRALSSGSIEVTFATIADNNILSTNEIIGNNAATTSFKSSIIHETNGVSVYLPNSPTSGVFDCLIVHEDSSFNGSQITVDDPEFIDRAGGDYHINVQTSPAVDYCDAIVTQPQFTDIDNQARGFDWPGISNNLGGFDVGFDEQSDVIFADGFASAAL